jgi:hypothetical protein
VTGKERPTFWSRVHVIAMDYVESTLFISSFSLPSSS